MVDVPSANLRLTELNSCRALAAVSFDGAGVISELILSDVLLGRGCASAEAASGACLALGWRESSCTHAITSPKLCTMDTGRVKIFLAPVFKCCS